MPFDLVETDVQLALRDKLSALRERMQDLDKSRAGGGGGGGGGGGAAAVGGGPGEGGRLEIDRLEGELADARRALKEQVIGFRV
jgi:hypothetical protein